MIEQSRHDDEGNGVAERQTMIASVRAKHLFGLLPHAVAVGDEMKPGLHIREKGEGRPIAAPVPQQGHRFADDIPGGAPRRADGGRVRNQRAGTCMVGVVRIKAGIEE